MYTPVSMLWKLHFVFCRVSFCKHKSTHCCSSASRGILSVCRGCVGRSRYTHIDHYTILPRIWIINPSVFLLGRVVNSHVHSIQSTVEHRFEPCSGSWFIQWWKLSVLLLWSRRALGLYTTENSCTFHQHVHSVFHDIHNMSLRPHPLLNLTCTCTWFCSVHTFFSWKTSCDHSLDISPHAIQVGTWLGGYTCISPHETESWIVGVQQMFLSEHYTSSASYVRMCAVDLSSKGGPSQHTFTTFFKI